MLHIKNKFFLWLVVLFTITLVLLSGCGQQKSPTPNMPNLNGTVLKGVTITPKSFQSNDFTDFFVKAKQAGQIVAWAGDWNELGGDKNGPEVTAELASTYDYTPVIEVQFFTQSNGQLLRPFDEKTKSDYKAKAVAFAEQYKPAYLGFGIETNVLSEKSPAEFENFVQFYGEVYDAVKAKSPNTKIFTVFQLEKLKGLGFFGTPNSQAEWSLLDKFPKSDILAFTTYPGLVYKSPSEIPADYYSDILTHTSKPIAFTEIGWHSAAEPVGWESSEEKQAEFVSVFFNRTKNLNPEFVVWSFLYDQNTTKPFDSMGLFSSNGNPKLAWNIWVASKN
ncbi:Uncharacterised protein [Candidatus Bilamarchaeum dharawalense]|uniref:Glycosyl hydrolase catalytic core n=1 Tax=Candidatus Bilamarchaeum dharawalense TaxID=2885759 RepID=A0A5E4LQ05_9ARCH|nr:Uncharacterised protein [Candidatus Bilamarchaeum dharawalense]